MSALRTETQRDIYSIILNVAGWVVLWSVTDGFWLPFIAGMAIAAGAYLRGMNNHP